MRHELRLLHNLVSIFQVENVSPEKTGKTLNISDNIQQISIIHQNDCTVSGHLILVTNDLENVDQG